MDPAEYELKKHVIITKLEGIHTKKELSEFMCKQSDIREPLDNV